MISLSILEYVENPCTPDYCMNGGNCVVTDNGDPTCECQPGFVGDRCQDSKCILNNLKVLC